MSGTKSDGEKLSTAKKLLALLLSLIMIIAVAGCSSPKAPAFDDTEKPSADDETENAEEEDAEESSDSEATENSSEAESGEEEAEPEDEEAEPEPENIVEEINPADMPEDLIQFLCQFNTGYYITGAADGFESEYDCENPSDTLPTALAKLPGCGQLWKYPGPDSIEEWEGDDPLGKTGGWGYYAVPKDKVIWAMTNAFNVPESKTIELLDAVLQKPPVNEWDVFYEYEENGTAYLYSMIGGMGDPGYNVSYEHIRYDGERYYIVYDLTGGYSGEYAQAFYAELELKETDGVEYWSLYRHTAIMQPLPALTEEEEVDVFGLFAGDYAFASGVGGWGTTMTINPDGTFVGQFYDSNMGESGDGYDSTLYYSAFSGTFSNPQKINAYTYSFELADIQYENEIGTEEIVKMEDSDYLVRRVYSDAYGLNAGTKTIKAYTEDAPIALAPETMVAWIRGLRSYEYDYANTLCYKCLYTEESGYGWLGPRE